MENHKESAFPHEDIEYDGGDQYKIIRNGLTKREYFAAMLLPVAAKDIGDMSPDYIMKKYHITGNFHFLEWSASLYSSRAIELADALLEKLNK